MNPQRIKYRCPHCNELVEVEIHGPEEVMVCPHESCGKPFQVIVPTAEPVPTLVVPGEGVAVATSSLAAHEPTPSAAPVATPVPAAPENVTPDVIVEQVHPVMFRGYPFRFLGYCALTLVGIGFLILALMHASYWWLVLGLAATGYGVMHLLTWWLRVRHTVLTVTRQRCTLQSGIFVTEKTDVPMKDIADVHVDQDLLSRILNVGDVVVTTAGDAPRQFVMKAIPSPRQVAHQIHA
jgi:membrane protein YdbS with pleckstrin-like domain